MEPISTALAGIALVKSSVDFIKTHINTAKDIGEIAGQIDGLFAGHKQVQEANNKKTGVGLADQFGVQSVAKEMIDAKLAAEHIAEVARMVDFRFGHGTWAGILAERQKRIQEQREAQIKARKEAQIAHDEMMDTLKTLGIVSLVILVIMGLFVFLFVTAAF
jgi:hypothetical protein